MITLPEFYKKVLDSKELRNELRISLQENYKDGKKELEKFLKKNNVKCSKEELLQFLESKFTKNRELSKDELDMVAGGCNTAETVQSIFTAGLYCAMSAIASACVSDYTNGRTADTNKLLCHQKL